MLVGQEGPTVSRVRGQELAVGTEVDADEAQRLVDADYAEEVKDAAPAGNAPPAARSKPAAKKPA